MSIAGGYYPDPSQWLWTTAIIDPTRPSTSGDLGRGVCTAVLIAPDRVLTAAHCVVGDDHKTARPASRFQVLVGRRDLTLATQGERRNVTGVAVHPKAYLPQTGVHTYHAFYDIAVLFLDSPVATAPAVIGSPTDWNTWGTVMGFGHFNYDHSHPQYDQYLRAADYDMLSDAQCGALFNDANTQHFYPSIHVCANNAPGVALDCITHGDSGGPLMVWTSAGWRLIGITSFYPSRGDACGAGGPFGFAWVAGAEMRDWPLTVANPSVVAGGGGTGGGGTGSAGGGGTGGGGTVRVDLSMAYSSLRGYARSMIRAETKGRIKRLKLSCSRGSASSFSCRMSWRSRGRGFSGKAAFWHFERDGEAHWTYVFNGKRRSSGCRSCRVKRLKW